MGENLNLDKYVVLADFGLLQPGDVQELIDEIKRLQRDLALQEAVARDRLNHDWEEATRAAQAGDIPY